MKGNRFAWARMNAYGVLVAFLAVMSLLDLVHPGKAELARLVGVVPPGQVYWVSGFIASGLLLLYGFAKTDRVAETAGLIIMSLGALVQTVVAWRLLGWTEYTGTRISVVVVVLGVTLARTSVLWSKKGVTVVIPPRGQIRDDD